MSTIVQLIFKVAVNRKSKIIHILFNFVVNIRICMSRLLFYIVEQVLHYHHSKFHSDTVFLRKEIARINRI